MKHKNNLGLNAVDSVLKEKEKQELKEQQHQRRKNEMKSLGLLKSSTPRDQVENPNGQENQKESPRGKMKEKNPELAKRHAETTKNVNYNTKIKMV